MIDRDSWCNLVGLENNPCVRTRISDSIRYQQDSSEFLGHLLDSLHEQDTDFNAVFAEDRAASEIPTLVQHSFEGKTFSISCCGECGYKSEQVDTFRDLQLSIPNLSEKLSVQTLLDNYLQPEQLTGDNRYRCQLCNVLTDGKRRAKILIAPAILILTLKHFRYDLASHQLTELLQSVTLDEHLILETRYELYAAVVHCGSSLDSGHYYTLAKDQQMVRYKFNDSNVSKATLENFGCLKPTETPYILFYSRENFSDVENLPASILSHGIQILLSGDNSKSINCVEFRPLKIIGIRQDCDDEPLPTGCEGGGFSTRFYTIL